VGSGGEKIGVAFTPKNSVVVIGGLDAKQSKVGSGEGKGFGGENVEKLGGHAESGNPKGGWDTCVK
jgi:hypothetical protein